MTGLPTKKCMFAIFMAVSMAMCEQEPDEHIAPALWVTAFPLLQLQLCHSRTAKHLC